MARSIKEIKKSMTDQFIAEPVIREKYGLTESDTFEGSFSSVSIEAILFGIIASMAYVLEKLFDSFKASVETTIAAAIPATVAWYHKICLEYQHGDQLVLDSATQQYRYEQVDASKQKVKYAAVRDKGGYVSILVSGEGADGYPIALSNDIIRPFEQYITTRKPAGVQVEIDTYDPDDIKISIAVQYDPLVMNSNGSLINDINRYPVEEAIESYLRSILYGGVFNKTKLSDAIQSADGVVDFILESVETKPVTAVSFEPVTGQNYSAVGGAFKAVDLRNTIEYVTSI